MTREPDPRIAWWTLGVMVVLGVFLALVIPDSNQPQPDCDLVYHFDGAQYGAQADPPRVPRVVRVAGQVDEVSCGKVHGHIDAGAVRGVPPEVAVVIDGYLHVRESALAPAWLMRAATQPVTCRRPTGIGGTWWDGPALGPDDDPEHALTRPYTLEMYATDGEHLPFERWQRLRLEVDVTEATELSPEDEAKARFGQRRFRVDAHCDGDRFVADRIVSG